MVDSVIDSASGQWQASASIAMLKKRARMLKSIRAFFDAREVLEVETPILSSASSTDPHIDSLFCQFKKTAYFLNTSPEYAMKRLLASQLLEIGRSLPIYQICKVFRDDEIGQHHNPEFTMLEWYRPGYDLAQLMDEVELLINDVFLGMGGAKRECLPFRRMSYLQAFEEVLKCNPHTISSGECLEVALKFDISVPQGLTIDCQVDDWLDWFLVERIIPQISSECFVFLFDYPVSQAALSRIGVGGDGGLVAHRFELLSNGLELANAFFELTDPVEQRRRFSDENDRRALNDQKESIVDEHLLSALSSGMGDCSGVAIGLDRLLMILVEDDSIENVISFSWVRV